MAETKVTPTSKTPKDLTFTTEVPPGVSPEAYHKALQAFTKAFLTNKAKGRAEGKALRHLIRNHKEEYLGLRKEEWKAEGLDPSALRIQA